ncbi:related to histidine kinase tcsA protein [Cephalotrichum gorgonifer]|uniref:histidine kinase n=1 Tax=Cephalotrichum gorgonifer TaxID=2041049 RepID=A0AAE8N0L0_9PEZI|nr:related to histidine kinase tcsA protein [Cephalotrichum gorgonifer]
MDGAAIQSDDLLDPPLRLFERLRQIAGYTWDESQLPLHTSFDAWIIHGTRFVSPHSSSAPRHVSSPGSTSRFYSGRPSPSENYGPMLHTDPNAIPPSPSNTPPALATSVPEISYVEEPVTARLSYQVLREERAFHIAKSVVTSADPEGEHIFKPLDLLRLNPYPSDRGPIALAIYQDLGPNAMFKLLDLGPAFYSCRKVNDQYRARIDPDFRLGPPIGLDEFLDFAIGATKCLEILHHDQGMIHGEIRGDAFHYNEETGKVRLVSFGSGLRSFEHGLTSTGWLSLSREIGAKNRLLYISPEQTGRMPAEPDTRTDIYSLGVLFWTLLTQQPVFEGATPLDIVQGVLRMRIPNVSTFRKDVPDVVGRIIQKCTAKNIADRYQSVSGLRFDLLKVQQLLRHRDWGSLKELSIGTQDVSSFFLLPTTMIGREKERSQLVKVIERVAKNHAHIQRVAGANRFSDASSFSNEFFDGADVSSEGASSAEGNHRYSSSHTQTVWSDPRQSRSSLYPSPPVEGSSIFHSEILPSPASGPSGRVPRAWERHHSISFEDKGLMENGIAERDTTRHGAVDSSSSSSLSRQLGNAKFRQRGHCEVITVEGEAGQGKSLLVQSVLVEARRQGYCATAKFDPARRSPYGPLLKLLSLIFKQVWGERNTETPFHQALQQYVRPVWPMLHKLLGLPEFLIGQVEAPSPSTPPARSVSASSRPRPKRRGSSPGAASTRTCRSANASSQSSQDFLRAGASTKMTRLINIFLDVLRMFTAHKFICFCIDDLHFADDESLELTSQIIGTRINMVIILTYRPDGPDGISADKVHRVIHPPGSEQTPRSGGPVVTRIILQPLSEAEIAHYVATTLSRPEGEISTLAKVIISKTRGNPFYMREMLNACNRKKCIWYDYRDSQWHFDIDKLLEQFRGEKDYDVLDTSFITRRLNELPPASRAILAWAAMFGQSFSFKLITELLTSKFVNEVEEADGCLNLRPYSQQEAIEGLQAALQAYILVPSDSDDKFRFAHDRYIQAAVALKECNSRKMHFVIAQTLMTYYGPESRWRDSTAQHICEAVNLIRRRIKFRRPFRDLLFDCAQIATENGARPTAAKYYSSAVALLQPNPWGDDAEDVSYDETMQLYLRAAECALFMGHHAAANSLLSTTLKCARTALDKAPAYVLQSRIFAQSGDADSALRSLRDCLVALGVEIDEEPTFEKCDSQFETLAVKIKALDRESLLNNAKEPNDPALTSVGAVLVEALSAAWWTDNLQFCNLSMTMLDMHLTSGGFPQSGMGFLYFAIVALSRFNMVQFAVDLAGMGLELLDRCHDSFTMSRGYLAFANFLAHVHYPLRNIAILVEGLVEYAAVAGDRISMILSLGTSAWCKLFASENCADLESWCQYGCEEIPDWQQDSRGGTMLLGVRQTCRALQGKTYTNDPSNILSDECHDMEGYKQWLRDHTHNGLRSLLVYETFEALVLYLYGHYDESIEVGGRCLQSISKIWTLRSARATIFVHGLALAGRVFKKLQDPMLAGTDDMKTEVADVLMQLRDARQKIVDWEVVNSVNYLSWSKYIEAQIEELSGNMGLAVQCYEEGLEHAAESAFVFEEALGSYLLGACFLRQRAKRSARAMLRDATSLYRQYGATGVSGFIQEQYGDLLLNGGGSRMIDNAVQTDFTTDSSHILPYHHADADEEDGLPQNKTAAGDNGNRIGAWRGSMNLQQEAGAGLPALDMIDLHAILLSSQAMSSVLQVDELLKTMCDAILQTCGGSATLASILVHDKDTKEWSLAASGDPEKGASAHIPGIPLQETTFVAENVVLGCARFREPVFIHDLLSDERFGTVSDTWLQRNPSSKAVIAIPISYGDTRLLGVLYLEGETGSFTDRNVTVLQLLVNQIGISYSNALAMKAVEKFSAENVLALSLQKDALAKALEAETKAKNAEAEAMRNVKLAEEAARAKSIFLANVSHELRTPLNGVIGNSELLTESSLNREQLEMADSIRVSAELLLTVINDILDYSRMEADKMKLYISAFNPEEMVREVVRAASYSNREKAERVKIIQDINLPTMLIYGDPIRLHQVLGNLIGNSIKFTETGSVTIGARVDQDLGDKVRLTFWVQDTGIGIPPQQLARLFQPFSQADASTARKYGGSGLGLSICKSLIETMMKGKIELESGENTGTRAWFTVTFDKALGGAARGDRAAGNTQSSPETDKGRGRSDSVPAVPQNPFLDLSQISKEELRICIAEDNTINQKIAIQYVKRLGYPNVDAYENGEKAIQGLREKAASGRPYHVILMDVQMPILDGYEATKIIRKDADEAVRKVLIIAMTASAIHGDREKCLAAGMNDYLAKPVRADVLKRKLEAYVGLPSEDSDSHDLGHDLGDSKGGESVGHNGTSGGSSDPGHRSSESGGEKSIGAHTKRQPRKLTKNRTDLDPAPQVQAQAEEKPPAQDQPQPPTQAQSQLQTQAQMVPEREKKGVLTKKPPG